MQNNIKDIISEIDKLQTWAALIDEKCSKLKKELRSVSTERNQIQFDVVAARRKRILKQVKQ